MLVDVLDMQGKKVNTVELPAAIFEAPIRVDLMHQAYVRQMANARLGTHQTKVRGEVAGGGRKPWKQKGTGRARQGSIRAAQWKGGGKIFTPHPRSYEQSMPRKMRQSALRAALSAKASGSNIIMVDELTLPEPKTRLMAESLDKLVGPTSVLLLYPQKSEAFDVVVRSTNNIPTAKLLLANYLNVRDLLSFEKVIIPLDALDTITAILG